MQHYGSLTPKGHYLYSNSKEVNIFDLGSVVMRRSNGGPKTVIKYVNSRGETKYKGSRYLKRTE